MNREEWRCWSRHFKFPFPSVFDHFHLLHRHQATADLFKVHLLNLDEQLGKEAREGKFIVLRQIGTISCGASLPYGMIKFGSNDPFPLPSPLEEDHRDDAEMEEGPPN